MELSRIRVTEFYPLDLHYIKALFLQKQYRQCIKACREILKLEDTKLHEHPLQQTFLQFYLALAHDELARAMHNHSQAKIPAFNQAELFYQGAIAALPTSMQCRDTIPDAAQNPEDPFYDSASVSRSASSNSLGAPSYMRARPMSPPTHIRNDSLPTRSPPMSPPGRATSDMDDLESHESFNEIMTPNRLPKLERDYSSMSLLQAPLPQTSQGLMHPIRRGSTVKPYHVPPRLPYSGYMEQHRSRLPRLNTGSWDSSPFRKQLRSPSEEASPVISPVSPLGSEAAASDNSTISPISPDTPAAGEEIATPNPSSQQLPLDSLDEHLKGMQIQLESHVGLLQDAKQRTLDLQNERAATTRPPPKKGGKLGAIIDAAGAKNQRPPPSRSYWSFTPENIKVVEKQKRIEAARGRGWARKRFDPTRYTELAEKALADL